MNRTSIAAVVLMLVGGAFALGRLTAPEKHLERARADERVTALREALAAASPLERSARLTKRLAVLDAEDLDRAIALYEREISSLGECEISPFVDAWTEIDPQAAITRISAWPYAQKRILGLQSAVLATASRDASAALPLFQELSERYPRLRPEFHARLLSGWAASNPETLRDHLLALPLDGLGPALGSVLGATARHHGVEFLITWTGQLIDAAPQDETLRAKIFRKAIRTVTRRDPRRAGEWATAHWGTPHGSEGPRIVAEAWILLEPLTAIEWIQTRAPAESRAKALEMAFGRWMYENPAAAEEWIESVERTTFHDPAMATYARDLVQRAPEKAPSSCAKVLDTASRERCLISVARAWLKRDREAAEAWIERSALGADARQSIRDWAVQHLDTREPGGAARADGPRRRRPR